MAISLCAWLHRALGSIGKTQPQETIPAGQDLHPTPKSGSIGETHPRGTTLGDPNPQPDLRLALFGETRLRETTIGAPTLQPDSRMSPLSGETRPRETTPRGPNSQPDPNSSEDTLPPSYTSLDLRGAPNCDATPQRQGTTSKNITLETLRAHNPPARTPRTDSHIPKPPPHRITPSGIANAAACTTIIGITRALDEQDPRMVAARTAQAIAIAVSTSRSYTAFLSAVTAAESVALLSMEDSRYQVPFDRLKDRYEHAIDIAANTTIAAEASITATGSWPFNINDTNTLERQQQQYQQVQFWVTWAVGAGVAWMFGAGMTWAVRAGMVWALGVGVIWVLGQVQKQARKYSHSQQQKQQ